MKTICDRIPNSTPAWLTACCALLLLPLASSHGHEAPSGTGCDSYDVDVANELALLGGSQTALTAAASGAGEAPLLQPGQPYRLRLTSQADVGFAVPPERRMLDEGAFAGIAAFGVDAPGTWRIGLATTAGWTWSRRAARWWNPPASAVAPNAARCEKWSSSASSRVSITRSS